MKHPVIPFFACVILMASFAPAQEPEHPKGAQIYQKMCVECHGKNGEGVKDKYDEPLHGNRSAEALARRIARTMPDDDVGSCVGDDAKEVAAFIYDAFYSPKAQARLLVEMLRKAFERSICTECPAMRTSPSSGRTMPSMMPNTVDLPAPL